MSATAESKIMRFIVNFYRPRECSEKAFFCNHFFAIPAKIWQYGLMKRIFWIIFGCLSSVWGVFWFTADIAEPTYTFDVDTIFPSPQEIPSDNGIDNVIDYIVAMIPLITTLMAVWAVIMVIYGGFRMVIWGANTEDTEKGKGIIKDAAMGLLFGLLAYVIVTTLWNILDI